VDRVTLVTSGSEIDSLTVPGKVLQVHALDVEAGLCPSGQD